MTNSHDPHAFGGPADRGREVPPIAAGTRCPVPPGLWDVAAVVPHAACEDGGDDQGALRCDPKMAVTPGDHFAPRRSSADWTEEA